LRWLSFLWPAVVVAEVERYEIFPLWFLVEPLRSFFPCWPTVVVRGMGMTVVVPPDMQSCGGSRLTRFIPGNAHVEGLSI
jgi:hypothetical protein